MSSYKPPKAGEWKTSADGAIEDIATALGIFPDRYKDGSQCPSVEILLDKIKSNATELKRHTLALKKASQHIRRLDPEFEVCGHACSQWGWTGRQNNCPECINELMLQKADEDLKDEPCPT